MKVTPTNKLCDLFDHARSSYYYQSKDKPMDSDTKAIIKSMRQIALHLRKKALTAPTKQ